MRSRAYAVAAVAALLAAPLTQDAHGQSAKQPVAVAEPAAVHGFSVALVLGDIHGASNPDALPIGAKKALADMRDFLPYKSFRLLDTQWILCCGASKVGTGVSGRLRGVVGEPRGTEEQLYSFSVTVLNITGGQLSVRFLMTDGGDSPKYAGKGGDDEMHDAGILRQERDLAEAQLSELRKKYNPQHPDIQILESRLEMIKRQGQNAVRVRPGAGKGAVIDSTFSMDVGETVVIGTSSLKGDKALIALLTAARRPGSVSVQGEKR